MSDPLLEVRDLGVHFDTYEGHHQVLDGVDLTVEEGETVALVGETGCGKSVTGKTIMGTLPRPPGDIVSGEVVYDGTNLLEDPAVHDRVKREQMSMIFQDPMTYLSPVFTVGETMEDIVHYRGQGEVSWFEMVRRFLGGGRGDRAEIRDRCADLLGRLQIPDPEGILDRYPVELSGGMRQRVLIAMALINDPEFLIADEPTTALDVTVQDQILDLLKERVAEQDLTMLYITHNLGVARELADRIYVMYAGTIAEAAPTEALFDAPLHPYTRGLLDSIPKLTGFESEGIEGRIPDYTEPPSGCRFHPRCPAAIEGTCDAAPPPTARIRHEAGAATGDGALHEVACVLYEDGMDATAATDTASQEIVYPGATDAAPAGDAAADDGPDRLNPATGEGSDQ